MSEPMDHVARRCARHALQLAQRTDGPVHLLGHSLGGIVIYRMFETGLLTPDRFSGDLVETVAEAVRAFPGRCGHEGADQSILAVYDAGIILRVILNLIGRADDLALLQHPIVVVPDPEVRCIFGVYTPAKFSEHIRNLKHS